MKKNIAMSVMALALFAASGVLAQIPPQVRPFITVLSPNGETWSAGTTCRIRWTAANVATVNIGLFPADESLSGWIAQGIPASQGYYDVAIAASFNSGTYVIQIEGLDVNHNVVASAGTTVNIYKVPDKVPLASVKTLKAYALTLVGKIWVQVNGNSVSGNNCVSVDYPHTDADPEKMAQTAGAQTLRFSATTDDQLESSVLYESRTIMLPDPNSHTGFSQSSFGLFFGQKQFKLEPQKGDSWGVPSDAYRVELELGQLPWVVPGMRDAYIKTQDTNGNQTGYYDFRQEVGSYWLDRGVIFLTEKLTSRSGELTLVMQDGSKVIYDLASENRKLTVTVEAVGFRPTIKGIRSVPNDTANIGYQVGDEIIRAAYTRDMRSYIFFEKMETYPIRVSVVDTKVLAENPYAKWEEFNPYTEVAEFVAKAGQAVLIRFDYASEP